MLDEISTSASDRAKAGISKAEVAFRSAEESILEAREVSRIYSGAEEPTLDSITAFGKAKSKLDRAKDKVVVRDYRAFLDAIPIANEAYDSANEAKNEGYEKREHYEELLRPLMNSHPIISALWGGLGCLIVLGILGLIIGAIIGEIKGNVVGGIEIGLLVDFILAMIIAILSEFHDFEKEQRIKREYQHYKAGKER